jgi:hypothetical protein
MIEFVVLAVVIVVPLAYLLMTVFDIQRTAYGATAATREAARVFVRADSTAEAEQQARAAAMVALRDHGVTFDPANLTISCSASPCLTPGATVRIGYRSPVRLPLVPAWGDESLAVVPVSASHTQVVDLHTGIRP